MDKTTFPTFDEQMLEWTKAQPKSKDLHKPYLGAQVYVCNEALQNELIFHRLIFRLYDSLESAGFTIEKVFQYAQLSIEYGRLSKLYYTKMLKDISPNDAKKTDLFNKFRHTHIFFKP